MSTDFLHWVLLVQGLGPAWEGAMRFFTFLGTEEFFLLLLPALYWSLDTATGLRIGLLLLVNGAVNSLLKMAFHSPRPYWVSERVRPLAGETSFGIPSGHAQISVGVWGMLAVRWRRFWITLLVIGVVFFIGLSRIYLGVHFPQDVLAGWVSGGLLLWAFVRLEQPFLAWWRRFSFPRRLLGLWLFSLGLIGLGWLARALSGTPALPAEWIALAKRGGLAEPNPWVLSSVVTPAAAFFGFASGVSWVQRRGTFAPAAAFWRRLAAYLLGLVGVIVLWMGLGVIFPGGEDWLPLLLRYVRYALVGFWIGGLAPYVFARLGLQKWLRA